MTEAMNERDKPSPLAEWLSAYPGKVAAITEAVEALTRHLGCVPDPRSPDDTRALLRFRQSQFRLDPEPAKHDARQRAAEYTAGFLDDAKRRMQAALGQMLNNIEQVMSYDARHNHNGLFAPDLLPREAIHIDGGGNVHLANRHALPADHPLHAIPPDQRFPWLYLCPGKVGFRVDGQPVNVLPEWATVSRVRRTAEEQRTESDRRERFEQEQRQRQAAEEELRRQREMTNEQRLQARLDRLEKQIAGQTP